MRLLLLLAFLWLPLGPEQRSVSAIYIVTEGDSLTSGTGASGWGIYPQQLALLYTDNRMVSITNVGISASVLAGQAPDITLRGASAVDAELDSRKGTMVLVIWGGTNDIYFGASAATTYSRLITYCAARKAAAATAGVTLKIVVPTALSRSNGGTPGNFNTLRAAYNASIRAGDPSYDVVADVAANPNIGPDGAETNATYFAGDLVHLNSTGYAIVAASVKSAINSVAP